MQVRYSSRASSSPIATAQFDLMAAASPALRVPGAGLGPSIRSQLANSPIGFSRLRCRRSHGQLRGPPQHSLCPPATFPGADTGALSTTVWALVHGLAFLHLDGKLDSSTPEAVAAQVNSAVHALFNASPAMSGTAAAVAQPAA